MNSLFNTQNTKSGLSEIDEFLFHSPYNKLVQKSFNRLVYLDVIKGKYMILYL